MIPHDSLLTLGSPRTHDHNEIAAAADATLAPGSGVCADEVEDGRGIGAVTDERCLSGIDSPRRDEAEIVGIAADRRARRRVGDEVPAVPEGTA